MSTSYGRGSAARTASTSYERGGSVSTTTGRRTPSYSYETPRYNTTTISRPRTNAQSVGRPSTARPRTGYSTLGIESQEIICAISESRGIAPIIGLAFVNLDTGEAVLSQMNDSQTYVRTVHKLAVFNPTAILAVSTAANPKSKLFSILEDSLGDIESNIILLDRRYWAEAAGLDYIEQLAFAEDVEAIKTAVSGNYFAVCSFAAVLKYVELALNKTFGQQSLRIKYEPSEGSMMIDLSTIRSLELVQNLQNAKSKDCLFGLLNNTLTPMGSRLLRSNVVQPLTNAGTLNMRYEALEELSTKEYMFFAVRQALQPLQDVDRTLTQLILESTRPSLKETEQAVNNVILLKQFATSIRPIREALSGARSTMLQEIASLCAPENVDPVRELIDSVLNEDTAYANRPLDLRNQRTYAVKSGMNGFLDVARQTYKEAMEDALQHIAELGQVHEMQLQTKFDNARQFYLRLSTGEVDISDLPNEFINVNRKKDIIECQTLRLVQFNQKIADAHNEVLMMSDAAVKGLISNAREHMSALFKICEGIAMLDMLASFAQLVTTQDYVRPEINSTLAIKAGRHPIREKIQKTKYIPNDIYATDQTRFQIITGCNMSGKSTYIRTVALMSVMAQIGSFLPAEVAMLPIRKQLFARISLDESIEANVSTFSAEMREAAFILRDVDKDSLVIVDELGRGTSPRDGLAIAVAIAEDLVESRALVWFATHFRDLARILAERAGVVSMHLQVNMDEPGNRIEMLYRVAAGVVEEEHYGLKLAKVMPLPRDVIEHAELVSCTLERQMKRRKKHSLGVLLARRRKLVLNLTEHLVQAREGSMSDEVLLQWLRDLQKEFVVRMIALDEEAEKIRSGFYHDEDDSDIDDAANVADAASAGEIVSEGLPAAQSDAGVVEEGEDEDFIDEERRSAHQQIDDEQAPTSYDNRSEISSY